MARILKRRVVKPARVAGKSRVSPQEINQWLQLGLSTAKIAEALIPDDPTVSRGAMEALIRARMAGADAPPSAAAQYVQGEISGQPVSTPDGAGPSQPSPPLTTPAAPVQVPPESEVAEGTELFTVMAPEEEDLIAHLAEEDIGRPEGHTRELLMRTSGAVAPPLTRPEEDRDVFTQRSEEYADNEVAAKKALNRVAVVAPRAVSSVNQALALYDNLVEATKPRGFFERLGYGMGARMDAVNKAFMANLNMSPLARKGSGAELKAATSLILQKAKQAAAQKRREHDMALLDERALNKEEEAAAAVARKVDAEARAAANWDRQFELKYDLADEKYRRQLGLIGKRAASKRPRTPSIEIADRQGLNDARRKVSRARTLLGQNKAQRKAILKKRKVAALATLNKDGGLDIPKEDLTNSDRKVLQELWAVQFAIEAGDEDITRLTANMKTYKQSLPGAKPQKAPDAPKTLDEARREAELIRQGP